MGCGSSRNISESDPTLHSRAIRSPKDCVRSDEDQHGCTDGTSPHHNIDQASGNFSGNVSSSACDVWEIEDVENIELIRAVLFRTQVGQSYGFGIGVSTIGTKLVTDLVLGGPADGQLQVGDRIESINGRVAQQMRFEDLLRLTSIGLSCMLQCHRLRTLQHPPPLLKKDKVHGSKWISIARLLPHITISQRRAAIGKRHTSQTPLVDMIEEEDDTAIAKGIDADKIFDVKLTRNAKGETFGFSIAQLYDSIVISHISSNISNWGMLQIGDELVSLQGVPVDDMTPERIHETLSSDTPTLTLQVRRPTAKEGALRFRRSSRRGSVSMLVPVESRGLKTSRPAPPGTRHRRASSLAGTATDTPAEPGGATRSRNKHMQVASTHDNLTSGTVENEYSTMHQRADDSSEDASRDTSSQAADETSDDAVGNLAVLAAWDTGMPPTDFSAATTWPAPPRSSSTTPPPAPPAKLAEIASWSKSFGALPTGPSITGSAVDGRRNSVDGLFNNGVLPRHPNTRGSNAQHSHSAPELHNTSVSTCATRDGDSRESRAPESHPRNGGAGTERTDAAATLTSALAEIVVTGLVS
eukprot:m.980752 g.980752  ORF g.980752 m.980752 type:complete len:583 (+) comp23969_c0_seq23:277-2025(+)